MTSPVLIREIRGCLVCLLFGLMAGSLNAAGLEFVRIWPAWREADSFVRISEYFGGGEDTGRQTVLRTQAEERSGFYFLVRTANERGPLAGAKFELRVILPDSPHARIFTFPTNIPAGGHVFNLGLTGGDWPEAKTQPVAWQLRLLDADGHEQVVGKSFLWGKTISR